MIKIGDKRKDVDYSERKSSYGILKNTEGKIAVVKIANWGLIFPGGKIEENENPQETIKRETLEETGYEIDSLEFYETVETYYEVTSSKTEDKDLLEKTKVYCHAIVDFYTGLIKTKLMSFNSANTIKTISLRED